MALSLTFNRQLYSLVVSALYHYF